MVTWIPYNLLGQLCLPIQFSCPKGLYGIQLTKSHDFVIYKLGIGLRQCVISLFQNLTTTSQFKSHFFIVPNLKLEFFRIL